MKKLALLIVGFSLLSLTALIPQQSAPLTVDTVAFKTEGRCMSRLLDKSPRFFAIDKCRLG